MNLESICDTKHSMSEPEIEQAKQWLRNSIAERNGCKPCCITYAMQTPQEIRAEQMLYCRSMINSCLLYGNTHLFLKDGVPQHYALSFMEPLRSTPRFQIDDARAQAHALTLAEIKELFAAQKERFSHAKVYVNVHTDDEGVSYNGCKWDA